MTNMEKYPRTEDALRAWENSNSRLVFSYWLNAPCDSVAPWKPEEHHAYDMDGWETGEWKEKDNEEETEEEK